MEAIVGLLPVRWKLVTAAGVPPSEIRFVVALFDGIMRLILDVAAVLILFFSVIMAEQIAGQAVRSVLGPRQARLEVGVGIDLIKKGDERINGPFNPGSLRALYGDRAGGHGRTSSLRSRREIDRGAADRGAGSLVRKRGVVLDLDPGAEAGLLPVPGR